METDVSLLHEYSLCFTIYLVFVASYTVSVFVFVVFSSRSCWRTNKMTSRTALLVMWPGFGRAAKRTKFWAENWQIQTVVTSRRFIKILSNFYSKFFSNSLFTDKKLCSFHMLFKETMKTRPFLSKHDKLYLGKKTCPEVHFKPKKKCLNALFIVEVHVAIKLVYRHSTFDNLKETIEINLTV